MRAGAVLSLLLCLMAVVRGAEVFSNPQFDGCLTDNSVAPWINGIGSIAHTSYPDLFTSIPPGDNCFVNLYSNPAYDTITQTITVPTTGTYDFSALYCCKGDPSVSCGLTLTINGQNFPLTGASITGSLPCTYAPATASGISLTAGSYAAVIKSTYSASNTVEVFVTSASLKPPGGASGDPHMFGFQGQRFDFIGEPGQVINLVTDPELQVNAFLDLMKAGDFTFIEGPVMMQMAFMTRAHTVIVNAGGYQKDQIGFVSVDDVLLPLGQSFLDGILSVAFTVLNINSRHLGLTGNDNIVAQVDIKLEGLYEFRVFMIENGRDPQNPDHWLTQYPRRFLDFNASLLDLDRRPHGVLGQTAAPLGKGRSVGEWTIEGKDEDYVVKDGLTGSQFSFNLFL